MEKVASPVCGFSINEVGSAVATSPVCWVAVFSGLPDAIVIMLKKRNGKKLQASNESSLGFGFTVRGQDSVRRVREGSGSA